VWAIAKMKQYGIADKIPELMKKRYQEYILNERLRGIRRGGANYPTVSRLTLEW
jgi:ATP-dependent Lon protease